MRLLLTSASYTAHSLIANAQRCVNLYPEANPPGSSAPATFYGTPGTVLWSTMPGSGAVRGLWQFSNGALYGVQGNKLYKYASGSWSELATLATFSGVVSAAENGISAVFVDGTTNAPTVVFATDVVGAVSGDGWEGAHFVDYLDGFLVFLKIGSGSQKFFVSAALGTTIDALDFASAESAPDALVSMIVDHREIILFGERTTEIFGNSGSADFPFERINGSIMQMGCAAKYSVARIDNSVFWLGRNEDGEGMVWRMQGGQPVRISTHALEEAIRKYATVEDAQAYCYQQGGHSFYVLTFPTENKTWCFDASTGEWHERAYRTSANDLIRHRSNCHVFYSRKHLVGDYENGKIYEFDLDTYTDNGDVIKRIKSFQHIPADGARLRIDRFELDMQTGVGSVAGEDPQVSLTLYADAGESLVSTNVLGLGKIGNRAHRAVIHRLGTHQDPVFEVATTANNKIVLQGAFIKAQATL